MKTTRNKALGFLAGFKSLFEEKLTVKASSIIVRNKKLSQNELDLVEEVQQKFAPLSEGMREFDKKRIALIKEYAEKDENGNPKDIRGQAIISDEVKPLFEERIEKLREEYSDILNEHDKLDKEFRDFLEEEIDIPFERIPESYLPSKITPAQLEVLEDLIISGE